MPLMSLIPLLRLYNNLGQTFGFEAQSYVGVWLAHTGFGLPLAIETVPLKLAPAAASTCGGTKLPKLIVSVSGSTCPPSNVAPSCSV